MRKCQALGVKRQWAAVWYVTDVFFAFPAHNFNALTQHIRHWGPTDFKICMCQKEEATTDFEWWPNDSGLSWFFYANCDQRKRWMILVAFDSRVRWLSGFFLQPGVLVSKNFWTSTMLLWFWFIWKFPELKNLQFQSFQKASNNWWLSWNNHQFHRRLFDGLDGFHEIINKELTDYERLFYRFLDFMITRLSFPDVTSNKWGAPFSKGEFYTLQLFMLPIYTIKSYVSIISRAWIVSWVVNWGLGISISFRTMVILSEPVIWLFVNGASVSLRASSYQVSIYYNHPTQGWVESHQCAFKWSL